jgi:hypothetical protein
MLSVCVSLWQKHFFSNHTTQNTRNKTCPHLDVSRSAQCALPQHECTRATATPRVAHRSWRVRKRSNIGNNKHKHTAYLLRSKLVTMQTTALCLLLFSACFIGGAFGVTVTYYTDLACTNVIGPIFNGVSNPLLMPLGACILAETVGSYNSYRKATACSSTGTVTIGYFTNPTCTTAGPAGTLTFSVGKCIELDALQSFKVSCSPAASASVAFFAVVAAVAAACM